MPLTLSLIVFDCTHCHDTYNKNWHWVFCTDHQEKKLKGSRASRSNGSAKSSKPTGATSKRDRNRCRHRDGSRDWSWDRVREGLRDREWLGNADNFGFSVLATVAVGMIVVIVVVVRIRVRIIIVRVRVRIVIVVIRVRIVIMATLGENNGLELTLGERFDLRLGERGGLALGDRCG